MRCPYISSVQRFAADPGGTRRPRHYASLKQRTLIAPRPTRAGPRSRRRRLRAFLLLASASIIMNLRTDMAVGQLDIDAVASGYLSYGTDGAPAAVAHQGKPALQHPMVAQRGQQLGRGIKVTPLAPKTVQDTLPQARAQRIGTFHGPRHLLVERPHAQATRRPFEAGSPRAGDPLQESRPFAVPEIQGGRARAAIRLTSNDGPRRDATRTSRRSWARAFCSSARPSRRSTSSKRCRGRASRAWRRGRPRAAARQCARMPSSARRAATLSRRPSLPVCSASSAILRHRPFGGLGRASARAHRRPGRSASSRSRGRRRRSAGWRWRPRRAPRSPR